MRETTNEWREGIAKAFNDARTERYKQFEKWGPQEHSLPVFLTILSEEVGELAEEILNKDLAHKEGRDAELYAEATRVAAVALAIMQRINTGKS